MEIEFKFALPAGQGDALQQAMQQGDWRSVPLVAHYFDTADGRLAASKAALRVRREGERWVQTAKAIDAQRGPIVRLEHNVDLGPVDGDAVPQPDWSLHADAPVGELLARVIGDAPLQSTYGTDITRVVQRVQQAGSEIELALDVGQIVARQADGQSASLAVHELEMELISGQVADLGALAMAWVARHGLWLDTRSKAERGEQLMRGTATWPVAKAEALSLNTSKDSKPARAGWGLQNAALGSCLNQLLPNLQALCAAAGQAEHVHQARVAMRRLRVVLRELAALAPQASVDWAAHSTAVQAAFAQLGQVRDAQVSAEQPALQQALAAHGLTRAKAPAHAHAAQASSLVAAARESALQQCLVALLTQMAEPQAGGDALSAKATRAHLAARLQRQHKQLAKAAGHWQTLTSDERHSLRKRAKRQRYLAEFALPVLAAKPSEAVRATRYLKRLAQLQEALGHYNDVLVAQTQRSGAKPSAADWFSRGYWAAQTEALAQACEQPLRRLAKAQRFWD